LTPLADGKGYFAVTITAIELRRIIFSSALLFASLAIFTPLASAQQCGYEPANPVFDSVSRGGRQPDNRNSDNCALVEFSSDNIGAATPNVSAGKQEPPATQGPREDSKTHPSNAIVKVSLQRSKPPDFNRDIYYRNKLEFSLDVGWLPINIPFPFDVFEGDPYDLYPLRYTLVPILASLRWHLGSVGGPFILRGNWDLTASASATLIPRGAETHYFSYDMGIRRNFIPRNSRVAPYVDIRAGLGLIDAKGPLGVYYAQGQNYTFTMNMGAGARYNLNPRYAISAGLNWMHISNNNLSGPKYSNYGINVYGPMVGIDIQLRRHPRHSE